MLKYLSLNDMAKEAEDKGIKLSELILEDQASVLETTVEQLTKTLDADLTVMENSAKFGGQKELKSNSGLTGGDGYRMMEYSEKSATLSGDYTSKAIAIAVSVAECNAAMGKIVASPTAGSCGVLPGAIIPLLWSERIIREDAIKALACAGGVGIVLATQSSIAGAEGGCQAECGSAAAMAAAALVEVMGGTPSMSMDAAAMAIKNQLGLVCDPVAGLVEVPCIKRNAGSVMCAITAADMALSGIKSVIPADEVVIAMREVGEAMAPTLKETAKGGLAATKTGKTIKKKLFSNIIEDED